MSQAERREELSHLRPWLLLRTAAPMCARRPWSPAASLCSPAKTLHVRDCASMHQQRVAKLILHVIYMDEFGCKHTQGPRHVLAGSRQQRRASQHVMQGNAQDMRNGSSGPPTNLMVHALLSCINAGAQPRTDAVVATLTVLLVREADVQENHARVDR